MSYVSTTDLMALFRQTSGGVRSVRAPTLDVVLSTMARAGLITLSVSATAPTTNQATTVWLKPATQSWAEEGALFLWDAVAAAYAPATPKLFSKYLTAVGV